MSLLNQVLRDLDNRRASALERQRIPGDVRPLSALKKRGSPLTFFSIAAIFLAAAAVLGWLVISLVSRGDGDTVAVVEHAPWPGVVPSNTVPSNTVPNNTIVQHELKLDASEIFASGRPATRSVTLERPSPLPLAQADKASGSIKGVPIDDFKASAANENSANIVVTPRHADQEGDNFRRAQGLIEQGAAANAELLLRQILTANPAHQVARQSLFNLLVADHRVEEAATVLADGLRIDPARTGCRSRTEEDDTKSLQASAFEPGENAARPHRPARRKNRGCGRKPQRARF